MLSCEQCRHRLLELVAERQVNRNMGETLGAHLQDCANCRHYLERLRLAEHALRTYPNIAPPPALVSEVLAAVAQIEPESEEWQLLPWDIGVPILACSLAVLIAMMSIPDHLASASAWLESTGMQTGQPSVVIDWLAPVEGFLKEDAFWAIWSGVFATTAGLGISLAISRWSDGMRKQVSQWEARLSHAAEQAMDRWRHAG